MQTIIGKVPKKPGIYFFKDKKNQIIYIGKAKLLRNRVRSYFASTHLKDAKTQVLVKNIADIDYLVVRSEAEALLTEANLIKQHKPRYNVYLKDDKTFPYIRITKEDYPKVEIIRMKNLQKDKHTYFGPYTDIKYLRNIMKSINSIFPETNHSLTHLKIAEIPNKDVYLSIIDKIILFLKGRSNEVRDKIEHEMNKASSNLQYEEAAKYRDKLKSINSFILNEKKVTHDFMDRDIVCVSSKGVDGVGMLIRIRNGHLVGKSRFNMKINNESDISGNTEIFIKQHYSSTMDFPKEILIATNINKKDEIEMWLSSLKNSTLRIINPRRGEKKELVNMCKKNADLYLQELIAQKKILRESVSKKVENLKKDLSMNVLPSKIEAFDISHISGKFQVGGMVTFKDGIPYKNGYRKFKIKHDFENNDFLSISEVISRRYSRLKHENKVFPDLILVDGGKGQLSAAKKSLVDLGLDFIPIISLAKKLEEVYIPESKNPLSIRKTSPGLFLLRQIRDEVHRFSIKYHRSLRSQNLLKSKILGIKGVGEKRLETLIKKYKTLSKIKSKSPLKISQETNISICICAKIVQELKS